MDRSTTIIEHQYLLFIHSKLIPPWTVSPLGNSEALLAGTLQSRQESLADHAVHTRKADRATHRFKPMLGNLDRIGTHTEHSSFTAARTDVHVFQLNRAGCGSCHPAATS
eukprot:scpid73016/ scgid14219/ 